METRQKLFVNDFFLMINLHIKFAKLFKTNHRNVYGLKIF